MAYATVHQLDAVLKLADGTELPVVDDLAMAGDTEVVRSLTATRPDESWSATDSHGHEHRYVRDEEDVPRLPSLKIQQGEEYWCEDCHDFHSDSDWVCRECGDVVKPGFKPDYEAQNGIPVSTTTTYSLTVEGDLLNSGLISGAAYSYTDGDGTEHQHPLPPLSPVKTTFEEMRVSTSLTGWVQRAVKHKPTGP